MKPEEKESAPTDELVPRSRFDTRTMNAKQALSTWHENIDAMFDVRVHDSDEAFRVTMDAFMLGDVMLANVSHVAAQSYERSIRRIGRDGVDHYLLQFYNKGSVANRQDKLGDQTRPGDLWITDLAQPLSSTATQAEAINLIVPRRILAPLLDAPDHYSMRIISGQQPLVALLRNHLMALASAAPTMTNEEAQLAITPTVQLAAAALNGEIRREGMVEAVESALMERVCRYVNAALPSADITLAHVAGQFGISTRKLSYLFEPLGGFASWVRRRRLALVRAALTDPAQMHRTVDEIAALHCFSHKANLGRAFRDAFGLTPGQVRELARQRLAAAESREVEFIKGSEWSRWIKDI